MVLMVGLFYLGSWYLFLLNVRKSVLVGGWFEVRKCNSSSPDRFGSLTYEGFLIYVMYNRRTISGPWGSTTEEVYPDRCVSLTECGCW